MSTTNKVNWAARGKDAVKAAEATAAQFNLPEGFKKVATGGGENAEMFIRYSEPRKRALGENEVILTPGDSITGQYQGSFESKKDYGGKKTKYHKVKVTESSIAAVVGKLVAFSGTTVLTNGLTGLEGKEVFIGYQGEGEPSNGKAAPHIFFIAEK